MTGKNKLYYGDSNGATQPMIDRWPQGYKLAHRLQERKARTLTHLNLTPGD
jgi:hypothetical protein